MKRVVSAGQVDSIKEWTPQKNSEWKKSELEKFHVRTLCVRTFLMMTIKCLVESKKQLGGRLGEGRQKVMWTYNALNCSTMKVAAGAM